MFPLHIQGNTDLNIFQKEKAQYSEKKPSAPFQFAFRTIYHIADFFQPNIPSVWSSLFGEMTSRNPDWPKWQMESVQRSQSAMKITQILGRFRSSALYV